MNNEEYILQMKGICKFFPGVKALNGVNLNLKKKSVHALCGENGAGKSTLMKVLSGVYRPDDGELWIDGKKVSFNNTKDSFEHGIAMVYQELSPIPEMTIVENMFLGVELTKGFVLNKKQMYKECKEALEYCGVDLDPYKKAKDMSTAELQLVEIVKAVWNDAKIIIMDEPTSAITEAEVEKLFKLIRSLVDEGKSIIYITHKMDEIYQICDTVTVIRDGKYVGSSDVNNITHDEIVSMMVGRELSSVFPKIECPIGDVALEVKNLTRDGEFKDISFKVHKGEILGVAGLMGAGRSETMETIFGFRKKDSGEIYKDGKKIEINSPRDAIKNRIAFVTEDRKRTGLNLTATIKDNIAICNLDEVCQPKGIINAKKMNLSAEKQVDALGIKTPSINQIVENLSGGNQQKVVLAKWMLTVPDILIMDEPTRGIDVGAKSEIHRMMGELVKAGKAVIMISSEMPEVMGMSDRIIVLHEGDLTGELKRDEFSQERILELAAGLSLNK